jgi:hypothetical protein
MDQLDIAGSHSGTATAVNVGNTVQTGAAAANTATGPSIDAAGADVSRNEYPAILDGTFFRVVSVGDDGNSVKAACVTCPAGKRPLSGTIAATTNFLLRMKVCMFSIVSVSFS